MKGKEVPGSSVRRNIIREESKNGGKRKNGLNSYEVVFNLGVEVKNCPYRYITINSTGYRKLQADFEVTKKERIP